MQLKNYARLGGALALTASLLISGTALAFTSINSQLSAGSSGADVTSLQTFLASNSTIYPAGLITGHYGPLTAAAVSELQLDYGLPSVGRVGPLTLALINNLIASGKGLDISAPGISGVATSTATGGSATVTWNTNEGAMGKVFYSTTPITSVEALRPQTEPTLSGTAQADTSFSTAKSIQLSGLSSGTTYYYTIEALDQTGNVSVLMNNWFKTQ